MQKLSNSQSPSTVRVIPVELAGQWIAWDCGTEQIVAYGREIGDVMDSADAAGYPDAILERVPQPGVSFIGRI